MATLLDELADDYDHVIVDSAPILPVADSIALSGAVDALLLVAQAGRASRSNVTESLERLQRVDAPVVGLVLNQASGAERRSYQYGGYGSSVTARDSSTAPAVSPTAPEATPAAPEASPTDPEASSTVPEPPALPRRPASLEAALNALKNGRAATPLGSAPKLPELPVHDEPQEWTSAAPSWSSPAQPAAPLPDDPTTPLPAPPINGPAPGSRAQR
jgi:hypothetical protein